MECRKKVIRRVEGCEEGDLSDLTLHGRHAKAEDRPEPHDFKGQGSFGRPRALVTADKLGPE